MTQSEPNEPEPRGIPLYLDDRDIPAFDPVQHREETAWYPSNESASLLVHIHNIWDDICTLSDIRVARQLDAERKLLFKYILVELVSLLESVSRLQTLVMKMEEPSESNPRPWRSVTAEDKAEARRLFKSFHIAKAQLEEEITDIRNTIGAHRRHRPWKDVMNLWDKLDPSRFMPLLQTIPPIVNYVRDLDMHEWARTTEEGSIQILGARIRLG